MRQPLPIGQIIKLNKAGDVCESYTILKVCGLGASSIVYDARKSSGDFVRIKECYPIYISANRNEEKCILVDKKDEEKFCNAIKEFESSYFLQKLLREKGKLTNSIMPLEGIYDGYGTKYIVSVIMEGEDLSQKPAESLSELLKVLLSVSKVVKTYHDLGYLHLDIKPANIFRIPETDEHIMMFDFDSLIKKNRIKQEEQLVISYSKNWAAPELVCCQWNRICEATDVYSIGSIFFHTLFGKEVSVWDRTSRATWNYEDAKKEMIVNVDTIIYPKISRFLHKTLASHVNSRYSTMDELIAALQELLVLADQEKRYICTNKVIGTSNFIGRVELLDMIQTLLAENDVIAVVGMGGIGKTELLKRHVINCRKNYNKIVFLEYLGSVKETICSDMLKINKFSKIENQSDDEFYTRKMSLLQELLHPDDLIILDNYDELDENIRDILTLPCKIAITTRHDLTDAGLAFIKVDCLDETQSIELFEAYNFKFYDEPEREVIKTILAFVEYHTLTIELIAKYLQQGIVTPSELLKLLQEESITQINDVDVSCNMNGNFSKRTVSEHIRRLYSISKITKSQREIMIGLSLMENTRISKSLFSTLFDWEESIKELNELIDKGWIKYEKSSDKITVHPVIRQIVLSEGADTKSCERFLKTLLTEYDKPKAIYESELWSFIIKKVFSYITGDDYLYAALCRRIPTKDNLEKAADIYRNKKPKEYLEVSLVLFGKEINNLIDEYMDISEWSSEENADFLAEKRINLIIDRYHREIENQFIFDKNSLLFPRQVEYVIELSKSICDIVDGNFAFMMSIQPREYLCKKLSDCIEGILDFVGSLALDNKLDSQLVHLIMWKLEAFYIPNDFGFLYEYICDEKKANWLKRELRKYREVDPYFERPMKIIDGNEGFTTFLFSDGEKLTIYNENGQKEWENLWIDSAGCIRPFFKGDELSIDTNCKIKPQREEVLSLMNQYGMDETWYEYYCAEIDSKGKSSDEADRIWMKAYSDSNCRLRFKSSNATEIAMACLDRIDNDYYMIDWSYLSAYCSSTLEMGRGNDCRNCYMSAVRYLLDGKINNKRDLFYTLLNVADYAKQARYEDDAIRIYEIAILVILGQAKVLSEITDIWMSNKVELATLTALKNRSESCAIDAINLLYERNVDILSEHKYSVIQESIRTFLKREMYKDIDFVNIKKS